MSNHCGLSVWQHQSTVVKATSDSPSGPFIHEKLVIPPQAHNPYYVQDPVTKTHLIYHIGGGDNPETPSHPFLNCTNGTTPLPPAESSYPIHNPSILEQPNSSGRLSPPSSVVYSSGPYMHFSESLDGPFKRFNFTLPPPGSEVVPWGYGKHVKTVFFQYLYHEHGASCGTGQPLMFVARCACVCVGAAPFRSVVNGSS
jgi:hypothetical protein